MRCTQSDEKSHMIVGKHMLQDVGEDEYSRDGGL